MNNMNIEEARNKGLIAGNDMSVYKKVQKEYKYIFEYYLSSIIDFNKYEKEIDNSNLYIGIGKNLKFKMLNEYMNLDYFFFISNLFVEKLCKNDIELLLAKFNKNNISDELVEMVKRTYKDVIKNNFFKGEYTDKVYKVCYGPIVPINFVDNDALVFKLYYGKNLINLEKSEFIALHQKQLVFLNEITKRIIDEIKERIGVKCAFLLEKDIY